MLSSLCVSTDVNLFIALSFAPIANGCRANGEDNIIVGLFMDVSNNALSSLHMPAYLLLVS